MSGENVIQYGSTRILKGGLVVATSNCIHVKVAVVDF